MALFDRDRFNQTQNYKASYCWIDQTGPGVKLTVALLVAMLLVGCATSHRSSQALTYDQLNALRYTNADCPQLDRNIQFIETQLRLKGLLNVDPTKLDEPDRVYNATARILIWNLRIGCTNPTRFSKK
jgi:hypothetical protein